MCLSNWQAFYLPETDILHWACIHPEYSKRQIIALVNCIASAQNWKRKARDDLVKKIENGEME